MIELYSKPGCGVCVKAKSLLNVNGLTFKEYVIGEDVTREQVLERFPGKTNLPIITIDGAPLGDIKDLENLIEAYGSSLGKTLLNE